MLDEILEAKRHNFEGGPLCEIPLEDVRRWMQSPDIEAQGALVSLMSDPNHFARIHPPVPFNEMFDFLVRYYGECLHQNPEGDWADSRYSAGWSIVPWFRALWSDGAVPRSALVRLKEWLASQYRDGGEEVRTCLVTAVLEHLLEDPSIGEFFADWADDPELAVAYAHAKEWSSGSSG